MRDSNPPVMTEIRSLAQVIDDLEARVKGLEADLSQTRDLEARISMRIDRRQHREELRQMVMALASGEAGKEIVTMDFDEATRARITGWIVDAAQALLAEIDRRCEP